VSAAFLISVVTLVGIYAVIVLALDLQFSYGEMVNLGIVAYVAAGAYAYAIVTQPPPGEFDGHHYGFGLPIVVGLVAAGLAGLALAALTAGPTLRMRGEYLALITFAFAEVFHSFLTNARFITNGLTGLPSVVRPFSGLSPMTQNALFALLVIALVVVVWALLRRIVTSPFGRVLLAVSDDEQGIAAVGKDVAKMRLQTFLLGSVGLGLAGAFFVMYVSIATPTVFLPEVTFIAFIALVLGGVRTKFGPLIGAVVLIGTQEALRLLTLSPDQSAMVSSLRVFVTGMLMVVVLRLRPPEHVLSYAARRRLRGARGAPTAATPPAVDSTSGAGAL